MHIETSDISNAYADMISSKSFKTDKLDIALKKATNHNISTQVVSVTKPNNIFIMCIRPDRSTVDKIAENVINNESKFDLISDLWKKASSWNIEIDSNLFDILSANELTALTLHEIGHMIESDSVPARLSTTLQIALANLSISNKAILKNRLFSKIAGLPIMSLFFFNYDRESIKRELRADRVAVSSGYMDDLISAMDKIENMMKTNNKSINNPDVDMNASIDYTKELIKNLEERKTSLVKRSLRELKNNSPVNSAIFESAEYLEDCLYGVSEHQSSRDKLIEELAEKIVNDQLVLEFGFGSKLKPITRDQLDYIAVKIEDISSINDKLMMVSYINSKIDLAEFYLSIIHDPKLSKKYKVPHSEAYLVSILDVLNKEKKLALNKKIPDKSARVIVAYPQGYEG